MFYGGSNAAQHSDRPIAPFMASPGLKIVAPSSPYDVKGLLKAAIREDDPVISFEDGTLWTMTGDVPDEDYIVPLGQADVKREGSEVTVVAISGAVRAALAAADQLASEGVSVEVVDPRSLVPMDYATILSSAGDHGADRLAGRASRPAARRASGRAVGPAAPAPTRSRRGAGGARRAPAGPRARHPADRRAGFRPGRPGHRGRRAGPH